MIKKENRINNFCQTGSVADKMQLLQVNVPAMPASGSAIPRQQQHAVQVAMVEDEPTEEEQSEQVPMARKKRKFKNWH